MRVERTMMAADVSAGIASNRSQPATAAAVAGRTNTAASAEMAGRASVGEPGVPRPVEATERTRETPQAPMMPGLSTSDRQAIASATGYYITAGGKVTPEGMPPWGFIVRYVEQRQEQRQVGPTGTGDAVERAAPVLEGEHVDVTV